MIDALVWDATRRVDDDQPFVVLDGDDIECIQEGGDEVDVEMNIWLSGCCLLEAEETGCTLETHVFVGCDDGERYVFHSGRLARWAGLHEVM